MSRLSVSLFTALSLASCCATHRHDTNARRDRAPHSATPSRGQREDWLDMFARSYFPGRSGQVFLVNREGDVITFHDELYRYMHGSPWDYDTRIPLLFYGEPFVRRGNYRGAAAQQDVAPTLGAMIGAPPLATYTGRVLGEALRPTSERPRIAVVLVLDAMRADYFTKHADAMPTLARMKDSGAWFSEARMNVLPTVTGVGHATVGTGTDPRFHGIVVNSLFHRTKGERGLPQDAYDRLDPGELMALTLADVWAIETRGRAMVVGHGGAIRATLGLVGRGACAINGHRVRAASYQAKDDGGWETNETCFTMPEALRSFVAKRYWIEAGGQWMGHDISSARTFKASSVYQRFEGEALVQVMDESVSGRTLGDDDVTDLVLVNLKGPDYTAHAYGPDSPELRETLAELDRQIASVLRVLDARAGAGRSVVAITADHGMPAEPATGRRHFASDIESALEEKFDPSEKAVIQYYGDAASGQMYVDTERLRSLGHSLKDIAAYLETLGFVAAAFTEDEVRAAQTRLDRR